MWSNLLKCADVLRTIADVHLHAEDVLHDPGKATRFMQSAQNEVLPGDRLQDISVSESGTGLSAKCQGAEVGECYDVSIDLTQEPVEHACTCKARAVQQTCKHLLALLCWRVKRLAELRQAAAANGARTQEQGQHSSAAGAQGAAAGVSGSAAGGGSAAPMPSQVLRPTGKRRVMPASFKPKPAPEKPQQQQQARAGSKQAQLPAAYQVKAPTARSPTAQPVKQERESTQVTLKYEGVASTERPPVSPKALKRGRSGNQQAAEERPWFRPRRSSGDGMLELADEELLQQCHAALPGQPAARTAPAAAPAASASAAPAAPLPAAQPHSIWASKPRIGSQVSKPEGRAALAAGAAAAPSRPEEPAAQAMEPSRPEEAAAPVEAVSSAHATGRPPRAGILAALNAASTRGEEEAGPSNRDGPAGAEALPAASAAPAAADEKGKGKATAAFAAPAAPDSGNDTDDLYAALWGLPMDDPAPPADAVPPDRPMSDGATAAVACELAAGSDVAGPSTAAAPFVAAENHGAALSSHAAITLAQDPAGPSGQLQVHANVRTEEHWFERSSTEVQTIELPHTVSLSERFGRES